MGAAAWGISVPPHCVEAEGTGFKYSVPLEIKKELWIACYQKTTGWFPGLSRGIERVQMPPSGWDREAMDGDYLEVSKTSLPFFLEERRK
jgi:hypothetical protein